MALFSALLAAVLGGVREDDESRFAALIGRHGAAIGRLVAYRERDPQARQDLQQEVLVAIWQSMPRLAEVRSERAWVLRIAHNVAATHIGRRVRAKSLTTGAIDGDLVADPLSAAQRTEDRLRIDRLFAKIETLELVSQQLVLLHLEGLDTAEIAEATGLTPTNVTTRLSRVRKWLALHEATPTEDRT